MAYVLEVDLIFKLVITQMLPRVTQILVAMEFKIGIIMMKVIMMMDHIGIRLLEKKVLLYQNKKYFK